MANDFSSDANCKAVWNLESGALTTDSKGGNTLTNQGIDEDTSNFKQGSCSGAFIRNNSDDAYITDASLDSGFPLKSGESNKTFSICFWFRCTGTISDTAYFISMPSGKSFLIYLVSSIIRLYTSSNGTSWTHYSSHATALVADRWYHVGVTYNATDDSIRIRIWDDTAGAIVGVDKTATHGDININTSSLYIGYPSTVLALEGNMDEIVVFNDVLSVADVDAIRAGTYGGGPPPETAYKFGSLISKEKIDQGIGMFAEV